MGPLLLAAAGPGCERTTRDTDIKMIRLSEVRNLYDRQRGGERELALFVDPRPERAFAQGRIPGARNLRLPQVDPKRDPDPGVAAYGTIVVYGDDPASATARGMTKRLMAAGYDGVRLYAGGLKEWTSRGYEVESDPGAAGPAGAPAAATPSAPAAGAPGGGGGGVRP